MSIKRLEKGKWLIQVQKGGKRKTKRVTGSLADAERIEARLLAEIDRKSEIQRASELLGVERPSDQKKRNRRSPTLRDYFCERWIDHAKVVQNDLTRLKSRVPFNYLLHYLGDKTLMELLETLEINWFAEQMKKNGSISFTTRKDGSPIRRKNTELTNATINKSLQCLKALLNLAHSERVIPEAPRIDMLPEEDSKPVIPPTEEQYNDLLQACEMFKDVAPLMREVIEIVADTGMRRAEAFTLTWGSIDFMRKAIRVERQQRGRLVNGQAWRPKHGKWREIPMSERVERILRELYEAQPHQAEDLVIPSEGGSPYCRMDQTEGVKGKGFYPDVVEVAGLKGKVTFHALRHFFAVRLLTKGVPITVVSDLLGHSDINLTVKRYGQYASDAKVKWEAVRVLG
jgi:integrase